MAYFKTKARAIDLLGKNQIADLPTAITELWKNGYDAYGDYLGARLLLPEYEDMKHHAFLLMDDGFGMSKEDLLNKWIVLGTDSKKNTNNVVPLEDRFGKEERIPLGEKGIGRLSVSYLGNHMLLITKKKDNPFELLFMNWSILDNYDLFIDDIDIPMGTVRTIDEIDGKYKQLQDSFKENFLHGRWDSFLTLKDNINQQINKYYDIPTGIMNEIEQHYMKFEHGTVFVIFDPIEEIRELDNKIDSKDNHDNYVKAALNGLFNPFDKKIELQRKNFIEKNGLEENPDFLILRKDRIANFLRQADFFDEQDFENCEHYIDGKFNEYGEFTGEIKVFGKKQECFFSPLRKKKITKFKPVTIHMAFWEGKQEMSTLSEQSKNEYEKKGDMFSGLYIYRDGFRVLPYGRTDFDFLGFEERRSKHAGNYYFSHRKMFGYIGIGKFDNPDLIDKSGREGLINNAAYKEMKTILIEFFIAMANGYYGGQSEIRQERKQVADEKKASKKLMEAEKNENRKQLIRFRKEVKEKAEKIKDLAKQVELLHCDVETYIQKPLFQKDSKKFLARAYACQEMVKQVKTIVPPRLSLTDKDKDTIYELEEVIEHINKKTDKCLEKIYANIYRNELADIYKTEYAKLKDEMNSSYGKILNGIEEELKRILAEVKSEMQEVMGGFGTYSPLAMDIDNQTLEYTQEKLLEINQFYSEHYDENVRKLKSFQDYMMHINVNQDDQKLLAVYKETESKLTKKVEQLHELAQLGMAVEIIDHQFHVMYEQISRNMGILNKSKNKLLEDCVTALNNLDMQIKHLEANYKLLVPLYMTSRRSKRNITGESIKSVILNFYGEEFNKRNIKFSCDVSFLQHSIYTYESVIVPIFINIINNAIFWVTKKENKVIQIKVNSQHEILIQNSGEKMKHTELVNCFQLFYTNKPNGRGIGLYLAKENLRKINYDVYATNDDKYNELEGACFVICELREGE